MKKFLIVVDAQNDFIDGSLANPVAKSKVPNIVKKINDFDGDYIVVTHDTHGKDYLDTKEGKKLPIAHCIEGTTGWEINSEISEAISKNKAYMVGLSKPTFGSMDLLNLMEALADVENNEEMEITLIGFCTDICVVSNALLLKANFYDIAEITVDASCCAAAYINDEEEAKNQSAALRVMKSCQINVINE